MKKNFFIFVLVFVFSFVLSFSSFAMEDLTGDANIVSVSVYNNDVGVWVARTDYTWFYTGTLTIPYTSYSMSGFRLEYSFPGYVRCEAGNYIAVKVTCDFNTPGSAASSVNASMIAYDANGGAYEATVTKSVSGSSIDYLFSVSVGSGESVSFRRIVIESNAPSMGFGTSDYSILLSFAGQVSKTELGAMVEKITDGWSTDNNSASDVDNVVGGMDDAESALNKFQDTDSIVSSLKDTYTVSWDFNSFWKVIQDCVGTDFIAAVTAVLSLALGAFIIGRSYGGKA